MNARSKIVFATEYEDARDTAKLTRDLSAEDFMALPRFYAYANLVAQGHPSGWALLKTLPPPAATTDPEAVRATARANYAPAPSATSTDADITTEADEAKVEPEESAPAPLVVPEQIGRKRRQR
jgi:hypothetical protein